MSLPSAEEYLTALTADIQHIGCKEAAPINRDEDDIFYQLELTICWGTKLRRFSNAIGSVQHIKPKEPKTDIGRAALDLISSGGAYSVNRTIVACLDAERFFSYPLHRLGGIALRWSNEIVGFLKSTGEETVLGIAPPTTKKPVIQPGAIVQPSSKLIKAITLPREGSIEQVDIEYILEETGVRKPKNLFRIIRPSVFTDEVARQLLNGHTSHRNISSLDEIRERVAAA